MLLIRKLSHSYKLFKCFYRTGYKLYMVSPNSFVKYTWCLRPWELSKLGWSVYSPIFWRLFWHNNDITTQKTTCKIVARYLYFLQLAMLTCNHAGSPIIIDIFHLVVIVLCPILQFNSALTGFHWTQNLGMNFNTNLRLDSNT